MKVEHQHPIGWLHSFRVPEKKWEVVSKDFIIVLTMNWRQHDSIMVVVDKLKKETHFILLKFTHKTDAIAKIIM